MIHWVVFEPETLTPEFHNQSANGHPRFLMINSRFQILTRRADETHGLGKTIGTWIKQPLVIALSGDLGCGKTVFVQGLAEGLDVPAEYYITSPTFTLINEYPGRHPLFHIDLYRLDHIGDIEDIGVQEILHKQAVIAIEWAEKLADQLPDEHLALKFEIGDDEYRQIDLIAAGHQKVNLIRSLKTQLGTRFSIINSAL
jgi:tRNA threonylcarbamoyladenosine biosynthesis protein TsaE